jgi:hypothetical protein
MGRIYDRQRGSAGPPLLAGTLIAGGYWEEWNPDPISDDIILAAFERALTEALRAI